MEKIKKLSEFKQRLLATWLAATLAVALSSGLPVWVYLLDMVSMYALYKVLGKVNL